jgi:hypothetical protein
MLKKSDITGFEKEFLWVDGSSKSVYQFFSDNSGIMVDSKDLEHSIKWEYIDDKNALKIGVNGSIFYYIFKTKGENNKFDVLLKSRNKDIVTVLSRVPKSDDVPEANTTKEDIPQIIEKEKFDITKLDTADKMFLGTMFLITTILISVILKMAVFFSSLSFFTSLFISTIVTLVIFVYLRDIFYHISKKYKKEIEDIIFKK